MSKTDVMIGRLRQLQAELDMDELEFVRAMQIWVLARLNTMSRDDLDRLAEMTGASSATW